MLRNEDAPRTHARRPLFLPEYGLARQPPPPVVVESSVDGALVVEVVVDVFVVDDEAVDVVLGAVVSAVAEDVVDVVVVAPEVDDETVDVADVAAGEAVDVVEVVESVVADEVVDSAVDVAAADEVVDDDVAHTVAVVGSVVNGVTVKSGVPPCDQVQQGSPKAAPLVMSLLGKMSAQKSAVQESPTASKAVAKSVNWELSLSGCPSSCEKRSPLGM
ncbi:unnamed protein product [Phytophthora fragariaefolia]|uniref:Unnamed protein product n=1 Tax=Phytophthora fragariaefolia TaxID=1490495 RepID=A0A9W6XQZ7_9STRA|nr:unnamed protein product [Phytophthora fragariaefolia]